MTKVKAELDEDYYDSLVKKEKLDTNMNKLPFLQNYLDNGLILGGWNLNPLKRMHKKKRKDLAVVTGYSISGKLQLGNLTPIKIFNLFNDNFGAKLFMPISDTEAILTRKTKSGMRKMYIHLKKEIFLWALKKKNIEIYLHSENKETTLLFMQIVKRFKTKEFVDIYGDRSDFPHSVAVCNMLSDVVYPYYQGYKNVLVILGIEEINHAKLIDLCAKKFNFSPPTFIFLRPINGLLSGKMSKSQPENSLLLSETTGSLNIKLGKLKIKRCLKIEDNPPYQIALWILDIEKDKLDKLSKELKYEEFVSFVSKKIEERYKNINNGKNKRSIG